MAVMLIKPAFQFKAAVGGGTSPGCARRRGRSQRVSDWPRVTQPASDNLKCGGTGQGQCRVSGALSLTPNRPCYWGCRGRRVKWLLQLWWPQVTPAALRPRGHLVPRCPPRLAAPSLPRPAARSGLAGVDLSLLSQPIEIRRCPSGRIVTATAVIGRPRDEWSMPHIAGRWAFPTADLRGRS